MKVFQYITLIAILSCVSARRRPRPPPKGPPPFGPPGVPPGGIPGGPPGGIPGGTPGGTSGIPGGISGGNGGSTCFTGEADASKCPAHTPPDTSVSFLAYYWNISATRNMFTVSREIHRKPKLVGGCIHSSFCPSP